MSHDKSVTINLHSPQSTIPPKVPPFKLKLVTPYSSFDGNGDVTPVPYVLDGLLTAGGLSVFGARPKAGKSMLSRALAVAVTKGQPFVDRATKPGEVLLISLEDTIGHLDLHLKALGYDSTSDHTIHIAQQLSSDPNQSIAAIREVLAKHSGIRLVVIDTLAKFLRVADLSEYMPTLRGVEALHNLAREFPDVHILAISHLKKARTVDPFDSILGSTALRGEAATNLVLLEENGYRYLMTETRQGRALPPSIVTCEIRELGGADYPVDYALGGLFDAAKKADHEKSEGNAEGALKRAIFVHVLGAGREADQVAILEHVPGNRQRKIETIKELAADGVLSAIPESRPLRWRIGLEGAALDLYCMSTGC